jgi:sterol desaturase/sphingolipid hydroxylase (fatty acid hydroxylase superfamily)
MLYLVHLFASHAVWLYILTWPHRGTIDDRSSHTPPYIYLLHVLHHRQVQPSSLLIMR